MELVPVEEALRAIVALLFAYVAAVGGVGALKFIALDQEVRLRAKQQAQFISELGGLFTSKFEEKMLQRDKRIEERIASFQKGPQ